MFGMIKYAMKNPPYIKPLLLCYLFLCGIVSLAQSISGTVLSDTGELLEDVAIFQNRTGAHTHTNSQGVFSLENSMEGETISFSRLGYETYIYTVTNDDFQTPIRITLQLSTISLEQVVLNPKVDTFSQLIAVDLNSNPVKSSQEILQKVPGLFIGQHAGGGKAEQIFLRGFDIDHGTDINLTVDGMPVNMVSHAHGQGYSDLHFLIPETIQAIDFGKGPYYANRGDFTTAGYVGFRTLDKVNQSSISVEYGDFDSFRTVGLFQFLDTQNTQGYLATSLNLFDGPFESPQNFNRFNVMAKFTHQYGNGEQIQFTASHFQSKWDASGQIPQRAVDAGLITRFGAIDDTEGGNTTRTNLLIHHQKQLSEDKQLKTMAYASAYDFELFSNFTFFLEDPVNGDQIKQQESRKIMGLQTVFSNQPEFLEALDFEYETGVGFRYDDNNEVGLFHTKNRKEILERLAYGNIDQVNTFGFINTQLSLGKFKVRPSLRLDYFKFDYENLLSETYDNQSETSVFASPKLNLFYNPNKNLQFFLKSGIGFHSNDTRVVVANNGKQTLPAAYGSDLGVTYKITDRLVFNTALWILALEQEFVYVGDAGIVEPSGKTLRQGLDIGIRYEPLDWLYLYSDANFTKARSTEEPNGADFIPLAPGFTTTGGVTLTALNGFSSGLSYRFIDDRPANENNSIVAEGYFITNLNLNYTFENWTFGVIVENLFDTEWNETQFATESRLFNEPTPIEEIHFTPGTPFFIRGKVTVKF